MSERPLRGICTPLLGVFVLSTLLLAQGGQSNVASASLGIGGLPTAAAWPLAQTVPIGTATTVEVVGNPNVSFLLASQALLLNPGTPVLGNQILHVDPALAVDLFQAFPGFAVTDATGQFRLPLTPGGFPVGSPLGVQAVLLDPTVGPGISLSGAIQATFTQAPIVRELQLRTQVIAQVNFAAEGLPNFAFFEQTWSSMFISPEGNITFQTGNWDFTPSPDEFHRFQPRIAPWWLDLDPALAGVNGGIRLTIDPVGGATGAGSVTVRWYNLPVWRGRGLLHSFEANLDFGDGGILLIHDANNPAPIYEALTGISPGNNLRPVGTTALYQPYTDFSTIGAASPKLALVRESFWEWYGDRTMRYYTQSFDNPYDLAGRTVVFRPFGVGATGAFYQSWTQ